MTKTNAMRILDSAKIEYTPYEYVPDENDLTGVHIAEQIGLCPDFVFKTLVARGDKFGLSVFCIPCNTELDLKKCARVTGDKKNRASSRKRITFKHRIHPWRMQSHRHEKSLSHIHG